MDPLALRWIAHASPEYAALVELRRAVLRRPLGLDFTAEQLDAEAPQFHLGAWAGARAVGCLALLVGAGEARMRQVAVAPDAQGLGIGRRLVVESEAEARRRGAARMTLHARQTAVAFYERLGYAVDGEPFTEVGLPHRNMRKALAPQSGLAPE
jgi:ribosomal protein S18 acetylase RimI-like enzyme